MPEHNEPEKVWDEYDWERFLQAQDRKTEEYMELLEQSVDDPDRDQIIAKAMGWTHLLDPEEPEWVDFPEIPAASSDAPRGSCGETPGDGSGDDHAHSLDDEESASFESHPLYQASLSLTDWVDRLFATLGECQNHPAALELATHCAMANAKLAAALSDDRMDEPGMTIAYLKRALKAVTTALEASRVFAREARLPASRRQRLHSRLFHLRDGIISLMGEYRGQWRQRFRP
ncbi:MAG TPA: hypothetical protein VNQ90_20405 [Chthoniobacteraceae bacterium]|nr:hypothetical protein [Chthoniobacteraceae bacterium]